MRITATQRAENENRIRAAMDRLLRGEIPPGGACDVTTLAREAAVDRTAFYGTRSYAHLRAEFERRLEALRQAGEVPDPREAQVTRLKAEVATLRERLARSQHTATELTEFRTRALARLAAQHDEIARLRGAAEAASRVTRIEPSRGAARRMPGVTRD
jgi:chromosome segregation ATPase